VPDRVRIGVLGLGAVAQAGHLPRMDRLADHFEIASIADLSPSLATAIGERYRVPADRRFSGLEPMLGAGSLDGLLILSTGSHGAAVLAGFDAGVAVFAEKPLAFTLAEADAIGERLAIGSSNRLLLGYMKLYDPAVVDGIEMIENAERVGPVRSIEVTVLHPTQERQLAHVHLLPAPLDVHADVIETLHAQHDLLLERALGPAASALGPLYANIVLGSIVHELALIRAFAGDPVGVDSVNVWPDDAWPPSVAINGRLPEDATFDIRWHFLPDYPAYREEVRVVTERATIELAFPSPYLLNAPTELRIAESHGLARRDTLGRSFAEAFEEELLGFHALVTNGTPPKAGWVEGRADIVTSQRIVAKHADQLGLPIKTELDE
jgi:predicted dehydrogenase